MSQISVSNLTFSYDSSADTIFENVSFMIDTDWKLGFIGRNGRGKTTFLNLLLGRYPYQGQITASVGFDYFPFALSDENRSALTVARGIIAPFDEWEAQMQALIVSGCERDLQRYGDILEQYTAQDGFIINELLERELSKLLADVSLLQRPFNTLSGGEKTKLMLAAMFLKKHRFLLIDEPTNHLDAQGRLAVSEYLSSKKGFILVSHDRAFLDHCIDHVLSINRCNIEVQKGNYSTWQQNKDRQDAFEQAQNERLAHDITRLTTAAENTARWSDKVEKTKHERPASGLSPDRGYIGHQAAKLMKRSNAIEVRRTDAIEEKSQLLKNLEKSEPLKLTVLRHHAQRLVEANNLTIDYGSGPLFQPLSFTINAGDRAVLTGTNGSGKTSLIKLLLDDAIPHTGQLQTASGLTVSYMPQDASFLHGGLREYAQAEGIDESLFMTILRKLDFTREQFEKELSTYSGGQKKKVLLAASLCRPAHLYIWDEPLNFIDLLSRLQIENLLLEYQPTMLFVEHDQVFCDKIATKSIVLNKNI